MTGYAKEQHSIVHTCGSTFHACKDEGPNGGECLHCDKCGSPPHKREDVKRSDLSEDAAMDADHRRRCDALRAAYAELYEAYGDSDELMMLGDAVDDYLHSQGYEDTEGAPHGG